MKTAYVIESRNEITYAGSQRNVTSADCGVQPYALCVSVFTTVMRRP